MCHWQGASSRGLNVSQNTQRHYVALPKGRIKHCTLSVCLSVRHVPPIFSKYRSQKLLI